jgi:uncharacterized protein YndB with AHSA1/START domain
MREHLATAEFDIPAPPVRVWELLTQRGPDPDIMFGAEVMSDWTPGSSIHWVGEWQGSPFDDYGEVVAIEPPHRLLITHTSTLSGSPAPPHHVEFRLEPLGADATHAVVTQTGNPDAAAAGHSAARWQTMLAGLARAAARSA